MLDQRDSKLEQGLCLSSTGRGGPAGFREGSVSKYMGKQEALHHALTINPVRGVGMDARLGDIPESSLPSKEEQARKPLLGSLHQQELSQTSLPVSTGLTSQDGTHLAAPEKADQLKSFINSCRSASLDLR